MEQAHDSFRAGHRLQEIRILRKLLAAQLLNIKIISELTRSHHACIVDENIYDNIHLVDLFAGSVYAFWGAKVYDDCFNLCIWSVLENLLFRCVQTVR